MSISGVATEAPLPGTALKTDLNTVCMQVTLHHMDHVQVHPPLVAQGYTLQVMASAILADPASYLQQTVCVFQRMGTFAIAAGFDVRWWDGPVAVEDIAPYHPYNGGFPQVEALSYHLRSLMWCRIDDHNTQKASAHRPMSGVATSQYLAQAACCSPHNSHPSNHEA